MSPLIMDVVGPDGFPAVFEDGTWVSHDRRYVWRGGTWVFRQKPAQPFPLAQVGLGIVVVAVLGYLLVTSFSNTSAFAVGYLVGVIAFFAVLVVVYRFAGRWGWFGIFIRAVTVGVALLKILTLIAHPPPA